MSNYEPELIWDDFVEGCSCCALNYGLEDWNENGEVEKGKKMNTDKYYSTGQDLTISMVEIKASSMEEAEAVMQRFIDEIAEVMKDEVRWHEADWTIQENTLNAEGTGWEVTDEKGVA